MSTDKVIALHVGEQALPDCPITVERERFNACRHDRVTLEEHSRSVQCTDCGKAFDAFDYLLSNARSITRAWADHDLVRQNISEKITRVEALKKEETRLRGIVKRLQDKMGPGINIRGRT